MVAFDGQSLNHASAPQTFPAQLMAGRGLPWEVPGISGKSWTKLTVENAVEGRLHTIARYYEHSVLVLTGGTSDIDAGPGGDNNTAAVALADMEAYADAARAAGFDKIIALTITPASEAWNFGPDFEARRLAFNDGIRNSDHWEYVVDVAVDPRLDDPMDATYYYDQVHWTAAGNAVAAELVEPVLEAALAVL